MSMQKIRRRKIGELMDSEGLITPDQLTEALERQQETGESIGEVLLNDRLVSESDIVRTICVQYQVPFLCPGDYERDASLAEKFEVEFLYRNRILPMDRIGSCYILAVGDIPSDETQEKLCKDLGEELFFYFSTGSDIKQQLVEQFSLSQDAALSFESSRTAAQQAKVEVTSSSEQDQLLDALDSSWESIFDEAEEQI